MIKSQTYAFENKKPEIPKKLVVSDVFKAQPKPDPFPKKEPPKKLPTNNVFGK